MSRLLSVIDLPDKLLKHICSFYLDAKSRREMAATCKKLLFIVRSDVRHFSKITMDLDNLPSNLCCENEEEKVVAIQNVVMYHPALKELHVKVGNGRPETLEPIFKANYKMAENLMRVTICPEPGLNGCFEVFGLTFTYRIRCLSFHPRELTLENFKLFASDPSSAFRATGAITGITIERFGTASSQDGFCESLLNNIFEMIFHLEVLEICQLEDLSSDNMAPSVLTNTVIYIRKLFKHFEHSLKQVSMMDGLSDTILADILNCPNIASLYGAVEDKDTLDLESLIDWPGWFSLKSLSLQGGAFKKTSNFPLTNLTSLELTSTRIEAQVLEAIPNFCPRLKTVRIGLARSLRLSEDATFTILTNFSLNGVEDFCLGFLHFPEQRQIDNLTRKLLLYQWRQSSIILKFTTATPDSFCWKITSNSILSHPGFCPLYHVSDPPSIPWKNYDEVDLNLGQGESLCYLNNCKHQQRKRKFTEINCQ